MLDQPWLKNAHWDKHDPKLQELTCSPVRLPHLDEVLVEIPITEGVFTILGPRQVGKSTLLRLIAITCLEKISPSHVAFVEGDAIESWRELLSVLTDFIKALPPGKLRGCLLIDEVTGVTEWHRAVKLLADRGQLAGILLVLTGSSATSLKRGGELFPGRRGRHKKTEFHLLPVSYRYLSKHMSLEQYFCVGGLPWAVNEFLRLRTVPEHVCEIYFSWIRGEFLKRGKSDVLLRHAVQALCRRLQTGFSQHTLAREMGIASNETARQYLELLEDCFAVNSISWIDPNSGLISPRKNRKYYPIDPLLFHIFSRGGALLGLDPGHAMSTETQGLIAELIVCQELKRENNALVGYWLGKKELDFVPEMIEVKYQSRVTPGEFAWYEKYFSKRRPLLVLTKNDHFHHGTVRGMPLSDWLCVRTV